MKAFIDFWQDEEALLLVITDWTSVSSSLLEITDWEAVESSLALQEITSGTMSMGFWPEIYELLGFLMMFLRIETGALRRVVELSWPLRAVCLD